MGVESLSSTVSGSYALTTDTKDEFAGYIFLCSRRTKPECFIYRVFGLPSFSINVVTKIKQNTKLFLFDFDVKLLYGVYAASSNGAMNLEPNAFGGNFPAQVRFEIFKECMPLPESSFKHVITYQGRSKFRQDLSANQVDELISLFCPLSATLPPPRIPLLPNEIQSRLILHQEIQKQILCRGISSPVFQQASESQFIGSRFAHSSYQSTNVSLPYYDSVRPLTSVHRVHEQPIGMYQHLPVSRFLPQRSLYFPEHPQQSYVPDYLASVPRMLETRRETDGSFHSGIHASHSMGSPNVYYFHQNENTEQRHDQARIEKHISAPLQNSNKTPSSVLADAYWAAVASEIPQPGGPQNPDNLTGQTSTSLHYKPQNLTSASILDAYWKAKALEDSQQTQPHHPTMLGSSLQILAESDQGPSQSSSAPYWLAPATKDQNWLHYSYSHQQPIPNTGDTFPTLHTSEAVNQAPSFIPGSHQQAYYPV